MLDSGDIAREHANILIGPHQISFDITNKCNFRCLHCYNSSGENCVVENEMTDQQVLDFIEDVASMKLLNFCFCGGEPLIRRDLISKCSEILRSHGIKNISLVTNGFLVTEKIAYDLISKGVNRIQVSLDGADAATYEKLRPKPGAFSKAINAIKIFKKQGITNLDVAFCPTAFNIDQFDEVCKLCVELGVSGVRVQPLMPLGRSNKNLNRILPDSTQYRQLVKKIFEIKAAGVLSKVEWGDPVDHLIRFKNLCRHCVNIACVKANGDIVVSPYLPLSVGNVKRHKFSEYWEKGLAGIWEQDFVRNFPKQIYSISDFNKNENGIPVVWEEKDIEIDILGE